MLEINDEPPVTTSVPPSSQYTAAPVGTSQEARPLSFAMYRGVYRAVLWLIGHAGPLSSPVIRISQTANNMLTRGAQSALPNPIPVDGFHIFHEGRPSYEVQLLSVGMFEPNVTRLLRTVLKPGMAVLDIGANVGYFSLISADLVGPTGTVWAFEPMPHVVELLRRNASVNGFADRVHVQPFAVSDNVGRVTLHINKAENMLSSLYEAASTHHQSGGHDTAEVQCTTIDEWAMLNDWPHIDLVKIDIEGAETAALRGMVELSRRNPQLKLVIEFNTRTLQAAGVTPRQFLDVVVDGGFDRVSIIGRGLQPIDLPFGLPRLVRAARRVTGDSVNILCEKSNT